MKKLATILGLGVALLFGGNAMAQSESGQGFERGHGKHHMMKRLFSQLNLSDQQRQTIETIREQNVDDIAAFKQGLQGERGDLHQQMKALVQTDTFDEAAFRQLLAQKQAQKSEMMVLKAKMKNRIWNVLTAEQQTQMNQMMEKRHSRNMHYRKRDMDGYQ